MRLAQIGNFGPAHSTENHLRAALTRLGHEVVPLQENTASCWDYLLIHAGADEPLPDVVLWTRTGWDWPHTDTGWSHEDARDVQATMLERMQGLGVPTVGYHLDRWWGLDREGQVHDEPFFRCALVITADGGHEADWRAAGVNHHWMPPGVLLAECERKPRLRRDYRVDVAFVGSHKLHQRPDGGWDGYHDEWAPQRHAMLEAVRAEFRNRFVCFPQGRGLRGAELTDLYGNAKVIVGDSCLSGDAAYYWSDRVPETTGRGGFLIHPLVKGLPNEHPDVLLYPMGDWGELVALVKWALANESERNRRRMAARDHTMEHHTYEKRMEAMLGLLRTEGLL